MAIAKGTESKDIEFKRYIGVTPVFIAAINPNKKEHETLFNTQLDEEPSYLKDKEIEGVGTIKTARISVILRPDTEKIGFEMPLVSMALFLEQRARTKSDGSGVQVIDKYGRTAWVTNEEFNKKAIPVYKNGKPASIDSDYRAAFVGEEELMKFVKAYLCIPDLEVYNNETKEWVPNTKVKPEECECRFDDLDKIFSGNFSEIKDALGYQPTNKVKVILGVRTDFQSGRLFQTVYTRMFFRNAATSFASAQKEIEANIKYAIDNGKSVDTEYATTPVHEYKVNATNFTQSNTTAPEGTSSGDMPFDDGGDGSSPWD